MEHVESSGTEAPVTPERVTSMARDTVHRVAEGAARAEQEARAAAAHAAEHAHDIQERALRAADAHLGKVRRYVEQNPLTSASIAFAAGLVLSVLLRR
jgi:ElaB/YqjD/DUF883 family membrane-anchored ribosome-binding protein